MKLREYQARAIDQLYDWFKNNKSGNPVINMPGGSGKSVVIASIVKDALQNWPETRILMVVHSKELILQNADKLRKIWPGAPLGIYSASVGKRQLNEPITYAGIGSVAKRAQQIGHIDLCVIDEVHAVSTTESGIYRKLLSDLLNINPSMRIIGLSASPYRLGHGLITEGDSAIFSEIIEPVSIEELVFKKHLVPLKSKITNHRLETEGLHKRKGEYISSEMEERFNTASNNYAVVDEIINKASDRKHWLIFCSGIEHSESIAQCLRDNGISAESLDSKDGKSDRERKLFDFESGKTKALCNVGILTTGYDFPALDCICFLRATASPGLYLQMAVRGMRTFEGKENCLVLDFAGVVSTHGPITAVQPPRRGGDGTGEAPVKCCDQCHELLHPSVMVCPECGFEFPIREAKPLSLRNDDIMGIEGTDMTVGAWKWQAHTSKASGKEMVKVTYYGTALSDVPVTEYMPIMHEGTAGQKAMRQLYGMASSSGITLPQEGTLIDLCTAMNCGQHPADIEFKKDGKFYRVLERTWN